MTDIVVKQKLFLKPKEVFVQNEKKRVVKTKKPVKNSIIINGDLDSSENDSSLTDESTDHSLNLNTEKDTYITPVYGVKMRVSLDNKYIFDMQLNLVAVIVDDKNIEWV
jgi:hypothetical protein